ncbi:MAG: hypothetical protein AB1659_11780, partial [Thermodesulfobacteriota bacterium]
MLEKIRDTDRLNLLPENLLSPGEGVYLVGGSVRDLLLRLPVSDYDIAVSQNPEEFANVLCGRVNGRKVVMGKTGRLIHRVVSAAGI